MEDRRLKILLVDDDELDAEAVERAFRKQKICNDIITVADGVEALDTLRGTNGRHRMERPYLVLLDLNMPRMDGIEFLDELRKDSTLRDTIVFMLTTSDDQTDKIAAYDKQVAGYMVKSKVGEDFAKLTTMIHCFWRYIEFPPGRMS